MLHVGAPHHLVIKGDELGSLAMHDLRQRRASDVRKSFVQDAEEPTQMREIHILGVESLIHVYSVQPVLELRSGRLQRVVGPDRRPDVQEDGSKQFAISQTVRVSLRLETVIGGVGVGAVPTEVLLGGGEGFAAQEDSPANLHCPIPGGLGLSHVRKVPVAGNGPSLSVAPSTQTWVTTNLPEQLRYDATALQHYDSLGLELPAGLLSAMGPRLLQPSLTLLGYEDGIGTLASTRVVERLAREGLTQGLRVSVISGRDWSADLRAACLVGRPAARQLVSKRPRPDDPDLVAREYLGGLAEAGGRLSVLAVEDVRAFENGVVELSEIAFAHHVTGGFDYLLQVEVADLPAYEDFHANRLASLPNVGAVTSFVTMKTLIPGSRQPAPPAHPNS